MNYKRLIGASVVIWIVGIAFMWLTCGWLFGWVYELAPNIWVGQDEMLKASNLVLSNLFGLIASFLFALVYALLAKGIPGDSPAKKGLMFGLFVWLVGALAAVSIMPFYMTIATGVVIYWIIQALIWNLIRGAIVGVMYERAPKAPKPAAPAAPAPPPVQ